MGFLLGYIVFYIALKTEIRTDYIDYIELIW